MTFAELELDELLLDALNQHGFNRPTPIQQAAIPAMMAGKDILAGAATGTGKTAAFVLPALQHLIDNPSQSRLPRILMLAPTRELALQIRQVVRELSQNMSLRSLVITGGLAQDKQIEHLSQPFQILIATPGRLLNLLEQEMIELEQLEMVIIDEADRMLDMGQGPDVYALLDAIPGNFQAGLFSATLAGTGIHKFAEKTLDQPTVIQVDAANQQSSQVQQMIYFADDRAHKEQLLLRLLQDPSCKSAIVFCNKKERAISLTEWLQAQEVSAQVLHGDFIQAKRLEKIGKFKEGKIQALVATDVAARGLDMLNITHVVNYDLPLRGDIYIHRIGRTGRAQNVGLAISLVEGHELRTLERIQYHLQAKIPVSKIKGLEARLKPSKLQEKKKTHKKKAAKKAAKKKK
ncbi:DEAD/DEAH box helicase [Thiomicrospira microaerophila]|uniref:DEAD/DEAH box helicase n=1 Tax=Thiomicrospira microaerophila TaxID=406020 RepID=UPI00200E2E75|nr:DEAD/DEAH box helicase [Thiomicrospira microaerophila]UQB42479.1 DEAD/DEAH box helicase [Thiomicrospira microaerophila]